MSSLELLATGVPGLDQVLGGGLPELSFNLIAGGPGSGKTTLTSRSCSPTRPPSGRRSTSPCSASRRSRCCATSSSSPSSTRPRSASDVHFVNLSDEVLRAGPRPRCWRAIVGEVERAQPGVVVVDSFRTVVRAADGADGPDSGAAGFVQRLALHLTELAGDDVPDRRVHRARAADNPVFTVADGILWLHQSGGPQLDRAQAPGDEDARAGAACRGCTPSASPTTGVQVFPRIPERCDGRRPTPPARRALSTGVAGLDEMLGGGIPGRRLAGAGRPGRHGQDRVRARSSSPPGSRRGEPGVIAVFEEHPAEYLARAETLGVGPRGDDAARASCGCIYLRPLDLSVDETLARDPARGGAARRAAAW